MPVALVITLKKSFSQEAMHDTPDKTEPTADTFQSDKKTTWVKAGVGAAAVGSAAIVAALLYVKNGKDKKKS